MSSWLRFRRYLHISPRFSDNGTNENKKSKNFVISYTTDTSKIKYHKFSPLLHYKILESRFRRDKNLDDGKVGRSHKLKPREIYYCNHLDSQIFSYYAHKINAELKIVYESNDLLNSSVIGYRKIKINDSTKRGKCNIDFAFEVFDYIKDHRSQSISVLCLDIEKFFDSIDPQILKRSWINLLKLQTLPDDHYAIFKAITRSSYIDLEKLLKIHPDFDVKKLKYFKNSNKNSLFEKWDDLRKLNDKYKIIHRYNGKLKKGIPQGTPISAALSNLYFLKVDIDISNFINAHSGIYRRYSDDILIVCETRDLLKIQDYVHNAIEKELNLKIQITKTQESNLFRQSIDCKWNLETFHFRTHLKKSVISYLGFDFDGEYIRVRNSSISNFYKKLRKKIRRRVHYARLSKKINKKYMKEKDEWIFRRSLFKSSSHLGVNLKKKNSTSKRGNYISYLHNAANKLPEINRRKIISQIRNHWKIIYKSIKVNEEKYGLPKPPKPKKKPYKRYKIRVSDSINKG